MVVSSALCGTVRTLHRCDLLSRASMCLVFMVFAPSGLSANGLPIPIPSMLLEYAMSRDLSRPGDAGSDSSLCGTNGEENLFFDITLDISEIHPKTLFEIWLNA